MVNSITLIVALCLSLLFIINIIIAVKNNNYHSVLGWIAALIAYTLYYFK